MSEFEPGAGGDMGASHEQSWLTATNPRHLLRLSRVRPNGRKYTLLACAVARHLLPGPRTDLGLRVLDALERFAAAQPAKGVNTHLWREVARKHAPELPDRILLNANDHADSAWLREFSGRLWSMSQVHTAEVNVLFDLVLAPHLIAAEATAAARREAEALAARAVFGRPAGPAGWFQSLLARANGLKAELAPAAERFREDVLARLPEDRRERVRQEWPSVRLGESPWARGWGCLTQTRTEGLTAELNGRACELVREVFGNPFRPPGVNPDWLAWNHGAARHIAARIAETLDFGDLPILADALEDAGCGDAELLAHCRQPSAHAPGCWALDAVLGL